MFTTFEFMMINWKICCELFTMELCKFVECLNEHKAVT